MAIRTAQFTINTTATELRPSGAPTSPDYKGAKVVITVGARDLFIGASNAVTTSTGLKLLQATTHEFHLGVSGRLWAIAAGSGTDSVLRQD